MAKLYLGSAILALFILLSALHCSYVDSSLARLEDDVITAQSLAESGDAEGAKRAAEAAIGRWEGMELYFKLLVRSGDADRAGDALYDFLGSVASGDAPLSRAQCEKLLSLLENVARGEKPALRNLL